MDIIGDAGGERYGAALRLLVADPGIDAVLVLNCPTAVASPREAAEAVIAVMTGHETAVPPGRPPVLFTSWVGEATAHEARRLFSRARVPTYDTPGHAVTSFLEMVRYRRNQELLMETPASVPETFTPDLEAARAPIEKALGEGRAWLSEPEAKQVLAAYGVPVARTLLVQTPDEAAHAAAEIGGPVALKIVSPDITHKSDVGGVVLDCTGPAAVREAAERMLERIGASRRQARIDGLAVQPMVYRPGAFELILGASCDAAFGPVLLFGQGGTAVEVMDDRALGLPPLNMRLAHEIISRTRVSRQLKGYRSRPGANRDEIALALIKLSQFVSDLPEVLELDVNPLLADEYGVMAVDARIKVAPASMAGPERLAIRPYPKELEEEVSLGDGRRLLVRPIRPEDEPMLQASFAKLTPEEVRLRFFIPMKTLSHVMAARFTQLDYDREMALVLTEPGIPGRTEIYGVVRIAADPDNERAEYAIVVRHEMTGMGLGVMLMRRIIDYARGRGIRQMWGDVLQDNETMRKLCRFLGFTEERVAEDPQLVRVMLTIGA